MLIQRIISGSLIFQHIIENMHDGVITIDKSGIITTVNPAAASILELRRDQILAQKLSDVFFVYPENDDFMQVIIDAVYDASMSHHKICSYYTGTHQKSLFVTTSFLQAEVEGVLESIGVTVLFSDVTELGELRNAAATLDKIKVLNQKLERLSYLDELTGLSNRRYFNGVCSREWRRSIREKKPLSVIMLDIDYFKEVNDSLGHQGGDDCLLMVAKALGKTLRRPNELVSRYGGDEFIVLLPDSELSGARNVAEMICRHIRELNIKNICSPFGVLTLSMGIASYPCNHISSWESLCEAADQALYRAKSKGRNQISE
jgi:diguanylate cyclase (GGDEF)-like protein/PAS domain S-box-containing protein